MLDMKKIIRLVNTCIMAALFAGCGNGGKGPPPPGINGIAVSPSIISKGQSATLSFDFGGGTGRLVSFSNGTTVSRITFGNATTVFPKSNTTYTLTVTNNKGFKVSESVQVILSPIFGRFTSSVGKTVYSRFNHTATYLPSNGLVLLAGGVVGGSGSLQFHESAELFNPVAGTSTATGFMRYSSALHTATYLDPTKVITGPNGGKVLLTGGWNGRALQRAQLYDPVSGTFALTGLMGRVRSSHTATLLNNGKVLITGGYDGSIPLASAELYDPASGLFTFTGSMAVARQGHTATLLNNGQVLIAGGSPDNTLCELYDPGTGSFIPTGHMTYARSFHTATVLSAGTNAKVLIAGGSTGPIAELYDPVTGTFGSTSPMTTPRTYHTATLLSDTRVLLAGGPDESAEFYDPNTRTFAETLKPMHEVRTSHTATLLPSGLVFIVGGIDTTLNNRAELFK